MKNLTIEDRFTKKVLFIDVNEDWIPALEAVKVYPFVEVHLCKDDPNYSIVVYDDDNRAYNGQWWTNAIAALRCGGLL